MFTAHGPPISHESQKNRPLFFVCAAHPLTMAFSQQLQHNLAAQPGIRCWHAIVANLYNAKQLMDVHAEVTFQRAMYLETGASPQRSPSVTSNCLRTSKFCLGVSLLSTHCSESSDCSHSTQESKQCSEGPAWEPEAR